MTKDYLNVFLIEDDEGKRIFFENIFTDSKIAITTNTFHNVKCVMDLLGEEDILVPEMVWINKSILEKDNSEFLSEIKSDVKFNTMVILIYSENFKNDEEDDFLVKGANILMKLPDNYKDMKKIVSEIITINWQYHTSGFNKNNFIMKV
ncbi:MULTISPECIES: response regulator [Chryseobacterium]|uniref:response regulator n=1 Tax=Chryseobacterium TaxID=59732 RepID=UPI002272A41C|nr:MULTISPECIES: response regulator [Chryseobacterium]MCY1660599.1 response regulator [Chryseobacterium sp. SL1]WBX96195.1 response regulator [Chryseobacterium gambrini]